jgi:hypothetical protein
MHEGTNCMAQMKAQMNAQMNAQIAAQFAAPNRNKTANFVTDACDVSCLMLTRRAIHSFA